jgi:hypothetical protein
MQTNPAKKTLLQKQFPTIIGLVVLVVALIAGIFFLGDGPGVFAPRATPQTTPKKIKVTNVTDSGFTISFITDEATAAFIKYGETADQLSSQTSDDRDQLAGTVGQYQTHHITIRGLKPGTPYFYTLGTGTRASFDDNGKPFQITTAKRAGAPSAAKTAYGSVVTAAGGPADGALVYVVIQGVGEMSSLVKSSGSYAIALSNARTADGSSYAEVKDTDTMAVLVQGPGENQTSAFNVTVADSQPITTVTLGSTPDVTATAPVTSTTSTSEASDSAALASDEQETETATASSTTADSTTGGTDTLNLIGSTRTGTSSSSASLTGASSSTNSAQIAQTVNLESTEEQVVTDTTPIITGKAAPSVKVTIEVHSETQIQQELIADGNGNFVLDIEKLKTQLEPGEHTATYSYTDPSTGELVTKTVTFTVEAPTTTAASNRSSTSTQLALASTSPSPSPSATPTLRPFGSGNPVPVSTSSATTSSTTKTATRSSLPATNSAVPVSGSVGTTLALLIGGFFFITAGIWSYVAAKEYGQSSQEA